MEKEIGNCMYAAIMHGVINVIGELPVFMTPHMESTLLGPNPTGVILVCIILVKDKTRNKEKIVEKYNS